MCVVICTSPPNACFQVIQSKTDVTTTEQLTWQYRTAVVLIVVAAPVVVVVVYVDAAA